MPRLQNLFLTVVSRNETCPTLFHAVDNEISGGRFILATKSNMDRIFDLSDTSYACNFRPEFCRGNELLHDPLPMELP